MTSGMALPGVIAKDICTPGYSKKVRNMPQAVKEQAYQIYGITHREKGEYEVDHLISLELGGSNSPKNLWPQSYQTPRWNAHVKDRLENAVHRDICSGNADMKQVQEKIAANWIEAYKERFPDDPLSQVPTLPFASVNTAVSPAPVVAVRFGSKGTRDKRNEPVRGYDDCHFSRRLEDGDPNRAFRHEQRGPGRHSG